MPKCLTFEDSQITAIRMAVSAEVAQLAADPNFLGGDDDGKKMHAAYFARLLEVLRLINSPAPDQEPRYYRT